MTKLFGKKIGAGSHVRVVAPARSLSLIANDQIEIALKRFDEMGLSVSFGKNVYEKDEFVSSSVQSRLDDLHEAFSDPTVDAIFTSIGGYNSSQLLRGLDYQLIASNPKILCGFSDITSLTNAIYAKTGLVGYSGPHFSTFAMLKGIDYTAEYMKKCFFSKAPYDVSFSEYWSDDLWFMDQENRDFIKNDGPWIINRVEGDFSGTMIGGHLRCFNALQGSEYMPSLDGTILMAEEDEEISPQLFDRQLLSVGYQKDFAGVKAILIGRFQKGSKMTRELLTNIIKKNSVFDTIPVIANCNFGHTTPIFSYPIGGNLILSVKDQTAQITINEH